MTRPTARVLALLELLQSGGTRTKAELAERLGVDERTVRRYVDHLIDLDVPVESVRGRYGGYRLGAAFRLPPLMLSDDEALAVLLGLLAGRRAGGTATATAGEMAAAKIRRVLPGRLARRLEAVLGSVAFTAAPVAAPAPDGATLLTLAAAVQSREPVAIRYTDRHGRPSARTLHPYGLVVHARRWYVTGADPALGAERTFRLDRIVDARALPGTFEPPAGIDPPERVLAGLARAPHRHEVVLRMPGTADRIGALFPAGLAVVSPGTGDSCGWARVELRAERLDWLPAFLASLDESFVIERPDELRALVAAFAERLLASAREVQPPPDEAQHPPG